MLEAIVAIIGFIISIFIAKWVFRTGDIADHAQAQTRLLMLMARKNGLAVSEIKWATGDLELNTIRSMTEAEKKKKEAVSATTELLEGINLKDNAPK